MVGTVAIVGATGYIGGAAARRFQFAGWRVVGLHRADAKPETIRALRVNGILPRSLADVPAGLEDVDVLLDAGAPGDVTKSLLARYREAGPTGGLFLYTSGLLVYGESRPGLVCTEETARETTILGARVETEDEILRQGGCVVRPGWVYGRDGGHYSWMGMVSKAGKGQVRPGRDQGRSTWIHVDDAAELFVRAAERPEQVRGAVFNCGDDRQVYEHEVLVTALAKAVGVELVRAEPPSLQEDRWGHIRMGDLAITSAKASKVLGWEPRQRLFLDDLQLHTDNWRAANP